MNLALAAILLCAPAALGSPGGEGAAGRIFLTVDEALTLAFPECKIERTTEYLSEAEEKRVEVLAHAELESRVIRPYVASRDGLVVGTAYFDAHCVRTKKEVLMLVIGPDERVKRVEVLSFAEPLEYLPKAAFYAQFVGAHLDEHLALGREVRGVAGATLSAEAATRATRRALAVQRVLAERKSPPPAAR